MSTNLYKDGGEYFGTHYWWDEDDNEYVMCATWKCEKNYPDMPDYWHLEDLEIELYNGYPRSPASDVSKTSNIWKAVEKEGPPFQMDEVDYS